MANAKIDSRACIELCKCIIHDFYSSDLIGYNPSKERLSAPLNLHKLDFKRIKHVSLNKKRFFPTPRRALHSGRAAGRHDG